MKKPILALAFVSACLAQQAPLNSGGAISGTVTGSDGTAIPGAFVSLLVLPPYASARLSQTQRATVSDASGAPLNLVLSSAYVSLSDSSGNAVQSGTTIPFAANAGVPSTFTFNVTGPIQPAVQEVRQ